jgi:tRNA(Ile)-lysidine synthase
VENEESTLAVFPEELNHELQRLNVAGQGMLLAVSGGSDSMAMLHAVVRLREQLKLTQLEVAHLNHGLRGSDSDGDADFVRQICNELHVRCHVEVMSAGTLQQTSRGSLEEAARRVRYQFLERVAMDRGIQNITTAHQLQDQNETIIFNLLRGTGLRGLRGIPQIRQVSPYLRLIRPMLSISKEVIQTWLRDQSLVFREDGSNEEMDFARNRIRRMMSQLPDENGDALNRRLAELSQQANQTIQSLDAAAVEILRVSVLDSSASTIRLRRSSLLQWPEPLVRHALSSVWSTNGWPQQQMNRDHWLRLSRIIREGTPRRCTFPSAIELQIRRDLAVLSRPDQKCS